TFCTRSVAFNIPRPSSYSEILLPGRAMRYEPFGFEKKEECCTPFVSTRIPLAAPLLSDQISPECPHEPYGTKGVERVTPSKLNVPLRGPLGSRFRRLAA